MERKIYIGSFNNDNKEMLKKKAYSYLMENKGDRFYYILPNSILLKKYRREFIDKIGSVFDLNLYTFDDVVNEILEGNFKKTVNDPMKRLILRKVLKRLVQENQIEYYKDFIEMRGFIESCINIIREIKRSLITPEIYLKRSLEDSLFREIGIIYMEYERELERNSLTDRENDYLNCIGLLEDNSYLDNLEYVIIDEFYDFRPIELEIIRALTNKDIDIYINMPFGNHSNNRILKKTIELLIDMGFETVILEKENKNIFETLGERLFSNSEEKFDYIDRIEIIKSPSSYLELKKVFKEIKKNLAFGTSLKDMGLVVLNRSYLKNLSRVSLEENIPLKTGSAARLMELPMIKEFCNLINTGISPSKSNILNRIKSTYFSICSTCLKEEMEYAIRKLNFKDLDELEEIINGRGSMEVSESILGDLIKLIDALKEEINSIPKYKDILSYNDYFLQLINDYNVESLILLKFIEDEVIFNRDINTLDKLKSILYKMNEIGLIQEHISLEEYYLVLEDYLSSEAIMEDSNLDGLQVLSPINTRGLTFKKLFIVGLSGEDYPKLDNTSFFLNDDNYYVLKNMGVDLRNYHERFSNEALKFATIISSCSENLYLSYNENSLEEGKNIPSIFIDEILSRINGEELEEKTRVTNLEMDYLISSNIDDSTCERDFTNSLLYKNFIGELDEKYTSIHEEKYPGKLNNINSIAEIFLNRSSKEFNAYSGKLSETIADYIKTDLDGKTYSISYLEAYSKCPYYFLLNKYFNVEEMGRDAEKYSALDIGSIYHQVLNHYYRKYKDKMVDIKGFKEEETFEDLRNLVYKYAAKEGFKEEDKKELLLIENIYLRLKNLIGSDVERLKKVGTILPWEFEVEFGKAEEFEMEFEGKKAKLRGVIDRIDKLQDNKYMIIDYKSSSYGKQDINRIMEGMSLQLPVYIMSQKDRDIVAASYITISDGEFFVSMGILGEADFINKRQKGAIDRLQWNEILSNTKKNIFQIIDSIYQGDFSVNPKDCSDFCPYKDICRYERVLEVD